MPTSSTASAPSASRKMVVAIAASTGGPHAIKKILMHLPSSFSVPIVIAQHVAEGFTKGLADWLNISTPLAVSIAMDGVHIQSGNVYINPAENSMKIRKDGMIMLEERNPLQRYRPSCNAMLGSVADSFGEGAIGVILTGMGNDGVDGIMAIKKAGGATIAQDEGSSVLYGMNRVAIERGAVDRVKHLDEISTILISLAKSKRMGHL